MPTFFIPPNREAIGFAADEIPGGYTYTITTYLGVLLRAAEERFGRRDRSFTILGVEYFGDRPHTWFPGDCKHVSVILPDNARLEPLRAFALLAHEVVHLLAPAPGSRGTSVFEEGLAQIFQREMCNEWGVWFTSNLPHYDEAERLLLDLLRICPDAVRRVRKIQPDLHQLRTTHIHKACRNVPKALAEKLAEPFRELEHRMTGKSFHPI